MSQKTTYMSNMKYLLICTYKKKFKKKHKEEIKCRIFFEELSCVFLCSIPLSPCFEQQMPKGQPKAATNF